MEVPVESSGKTPVRCLGDKFPHKLFLIFVNECLQFDVLEEKDISKLAKTTIIKN